MAASHGQAGVAILVRQGNSEVSELKIVLHSERLILVKLKAEPVDLVIIHVYMPTSAHEDTEVEKIYNQVE